MGLWIDVNKCVDKAQQICYICQRHGGKMEQIFADRLKSARQLAGLSLRELSSKLVPELSYQAISNYEKGIRKPDSSIIVAFAEALNVPIDYFFRSSRINLANVEFRKKSKLGKKNIERIKEYIRDYLDRYFEIENILNLNTDFINPIENCNILNLNDIESSAIELRKKWDLGLNPVHNIIEMLEEKGVKVIEADVENEFDGLSAWVGNTPVIVVNTNFDTVRKRFTVLHELAHLLLEFDKNTEQKDREKYCHSFAGAFLLPEVSLLEMIGMKRRKFSLTELIEIKEYYGISVQAIIYRLFNLGLLNETQKREFFIYVNKNSQKDEKNWGVYRGEESSSRFKRLILASAGEEVISLSKAAQLLNIDLDKFRKELMIIK